MATARPIPGRRCWTAALIALSVGLLLGCENDPKPSPEAPRAASRPTLAAADPAVTCADDPTQPHCGCGENCSGKCGDGCSQAAAAAAPAAGCGEAPKAAATGCGCGSHAPGAAPPADGPVVENGKASIGDRTMCPVMNSAFIVKPDSPKTEHQGKTYFFCCEGCIDQFKKKPESFI